MDTSKLTIVMLTVKISPADIQAHITQRIGKLTEGHIIKTVAYLPDGEGCLVCLFGFRQVYMTSWRDCVVPLFGEEYLPMLNGDIQRGYKSRVHEMRTKGVLLYGSPLVKSYARVVLDVEHAQPAKRTRVVLSDGQAGVVSMQQTTLRVEEPKPEPEPQPALLTVRDPFEQGNYKKSIKALLTKARPWEDPSPVPVRQPGEGARDYFRRVLHASFAPPPGADCLKALLPPSVRGYPNYAPLLTTLSLTEVHMKALSDCHAFFTAKQWEGFQCLLPLGDMQAVNYNYPLGKPACIECCVFEGVRRALRLEVATADMARYIKGVADSAPSLFPIPRLTQGLMRLLIEFNCGASGVGEGMWAPLGEADSARLQRLDCGPPGAVLEMHGMLTALRTFRPSAFAARYAMGTPLEWSLVALSSLYKHAERLGDLRAEGAAEEVLRSLRTEWDARAEVYVECAKPLFKYGGILTKLVEQLGKMCGVLREVGDALPFPSVQLAKLSINGKLIHPLSKINLKYGHLELDLPLLPFPHICASLELTEDLETLSAERLRAEWEDVTRMCEAVGVDPAKSPAIRFARNGQQQVAARLRGGYTLDLPATASMPFAQYNPAALYADPA